MKQKTTMVLSTIAMAIVLAISITGFTGCKKALDNIMCPTSAYPLYCPYSGKCCPSGYPYECGDGKCYTTPSCPTGTAHVCS